MGLRIKKIKTVQEESLDPSIKYFQNHLEQRYISEVKFNT